MENKTIMHDIYFKNKTNNHSVMITQYKHVFTSETESKKVTISLANCSSSDSTCSYYWTASGTSYNGMSTANGRSGDSIIFSNSSISTDTNCSVWDVWCDEDPNFRISILLIRYNSEDYVEGGYCQELQDEIDEYKEYMDEKYSQIDNLISGLTKQVNSDLQVVLDNANALIDNAKEEVANAQTSIEDAKKELEETKETLANFKEDLGNVTIDVDSLAGKVTETAAFTSATSGYITSVTDEINAQIGGIITSAKTWNAAADTTTFYQKVISTIDGYVSEEVKYVDVDGNKVNSLLGMMDAVNGKIEQSATSVKTDINDTIVTNVKTYLNSEEGKAAITGSATNVTAKQVTYGGTTLDVTLGNLTEEIASANTDSQEALRLSQSFDLSAKTISTRVEELSGGTSTRFTAIEQQVDDIKSIVEDSEGGKSSVILQELSAITLTVKDGEKNVGISIASENEEGKIVLDADKVVIPGDLLANAISAQTISLGADNSKFYGDGSGYLANKNISWKTDGSGQIANSGITWDSDGNITFKQKVTIDGDTIAQAISAQTITLGSGASEFSYDGSGYVSNRNISWNSDGSGQIAKSGITWDSDGNIHIEKEVTIDGDTIAQAISAHSITLGNGTSQFNADGSGFVSNSGITWDMRGNLFIGGDKVVISGNTIAKSLSANTITLGSGTSKFNKDGDGYVSNGNISWSTDGSGQIANSAITWTSGGQITFNEGVTINADTIAQSISAKTITLGGGTSQFNENGSGYVSNRNISWNTDGSGQIAKSGITWDSAGNITFKNNVTIDGDTIAQAISAHSITLGGGTSQFNGDGSGYVANEQISWSKDGDLRLSGTPIAQALSAETVVFNGDGSIANSAMTWDNKGNVTFHNNVTINGDTIANAITATTITLGQNASQFKNDGSGYLANSAITWTNSGDLYLGGSKVHISGNTIASAITATTITLGKGSCEFRDNGSGEVAQGYISWNSDGSGYVANEAIKWDSAGKITFKNDVLANSLSATTITLGQNASKFNSTGGGYLANSAITWTDSGEMTISSSVTINSKLTVDSISIKDDNKVVGGVNVGNYAFFGGGTNGDNSSFSVDFKGNLKAANVNICGTLGRTPKYMGTLFPTTDDYSTSPTKLAVNSYINVPILKDYIDYVNASSNNSTLCSTTDLENIGSTAVGKTATISMCDLRYIGNYVVFDTKDNALTNGGTTVYLVLPVNFGKLPSGYTSSKVAYNGVTSKYANSAVTADDLPTFDYDYAFSMVGTKFTLLLKGSALNNISLVPSEYIISNSIDSDGGPDGGEINDANIDTWFAPFVLNKCSLLHDSSGYITALTADKRCQYFYADGLSETKSTIDYSNWPNITTTTTTKSCDILLNLECKERNRIVNKTSSSTDKIGTTDIYWEITCTYL